MNSSNNMNEEKNRRKGKFWHPAIVLPFVGLLMILAVLLGVVPFSDGQGANAAQAPYFAETAQKININEADIEALLLLPGIGEVKAQAVIDYREEHGPFSSCEELLDVEGIGPETLKEIEGYILFA